MASTSDAAYWHQSYIGVNALSRTCLEDRGGNYLRDHGEFRGTPPTEANREPGVDPCPGVRSAQPEGSV